MHKKICVYNEKKGRINKIHLESISRKTPELGRIFYVSPVGSPEQFENSNWRFMHDFHPAM